MDLKRDKVNSSGKMDPFTKANLKMIKNTEKGILNLNKEVLRESGKTIKLMELGILSLVTKELVDNGKEMNIRDLKNFSDIFHLIIFFVIIFI